ncbi:MAG: hypothetical protein DCC67_02505 [Planctomycetota bacterium]|nr:MAG: hypothetical protein DCC67_02505 [Planctomycetota bacterium]
MGRINETVHTFNSFVRTVLFAVLVAGAGLAGWKAYSIYNEPQQKLDQKQRELDSMATKLRQTAADLDASRRQIDSLSAEIQKKNEAIARLETANHLLKLRHRIARLKVTEQTTDPATGRSRTEIEFYEVNEEGAPVGERRQRFTLDGDRVYVECLLAKFDDKYIEANDLDRRTAICLFQRIFGEHQQPHEGFAIDQVGSAPTSYARGGEMSEFEKRIWQDFWTLANDPAKASELGIRAVHADAPSMQVEKGGVYELELRTTGDFTFRRVAEPSATAAEQS